ncbi:helix-turn-helix transcriptional regulator [Endomicrobium sp. AH-315-J14]|nr:helix-turn-helix transcriptional regulator [Endomicrobium sp. AH-315-J14]
MDYATFAKKLGLNIRKARWMRGWTQGDVAAKGVSYRYYQEVERGQRNPTTHMLFELAQILGVTVADLTNVAGARPSDPPLTAQKATAPRRGRKPKSRRRKE